MSLYPWSTRITKLMTRTKNLSTIWKKAVFRICQYRNTGLAPKSKLFLKARE